MARASRLVRSAIVFAAAACGGRVSEPLNPSPALTPTISLPAGGDYNLTVNVGLSLGAPCFTIIAGQQSAIDTLTLDAIVTVENSAATLRPSAAGDRGMIATLHVVGNSVAGPITGVGADARGATVQIGVPVFGAQSESRLVGTSTAPNTYQGSITGGVNVSLNGSGTVCAGGVFLLRPR